MKNKRINGDFIVSMREWAANFKNYGYVDFEFMPIDACILEDTGMAFGEMFRAHEICNFNTCVSLQRLALISPSTVDLVERKNCHHESSLWEDAMLEWLDKFSTKFGLGSKFEYLYFFNLHGDATLYLDLNEQQLSKLKAYFVEEYDAERISHSWSFEEVKGGFIEHFYILVTNNSKDVRSGSLAFYSLRSIDEIEHRRSCSFSMLPLQTGLMQSFLTGNQFAKPHTRVSFEYRLREGVSHGGLKYGAWADFSCHALELFCLVFDLEQLRVFTIAYYKSGSVFVDFYFENEFSDEVLRQLISNFSEGNFGVWLVPGRSNPGLLEGVVCHGVSELDFSFEDFANSLPQENVSFYALFDLEKRLAVRRYSYSLKPGTQKTQSFTAFNHFRVFFDHDVLESIPSGEEATNTKWWFKPALYDDRLWPKEPPDDALQEK